jgi:hypothetical protein
MSADIIKNLVITQFLTMEAIGTDKDPCFVLFSRGVHTRRESASGASEISKQSGLCLRNEQAQCLSISEKNSNYFQNLLNTKKWHFEETATIFLLLLST